MVKDQDIAWALQVPRANDHRKHFVAHIWDNQTKQSALQSFYAYSKDDAVILAREYCARYGDYSLKGLKLWKFS